MDNKNGFWRKAGVIITIVVVVLTAVFGYGLLCGSVKTNKDNIAEIKPKVQSNAEDIKNIEGKLEYIKDGIDDIKQELREK